MQDTIETNQTQLNNLVKERIARKIQNGAENAKAAYERLVNEGKIQRDFIPHIGVHKFNAGVGSDLYAEPTEEKLLLNMKHDNGTLQFGVHENALIQVADRISIPSGYLKGLAAGDLKHKTLAAKIINEHMEWTQRSRVLLRTVGDQARAILSDRYRRMNSTEILTTYIEESYAQGALLVDGYMNDTKIFLETILPEPMFLNTENNGVIALAFGSRISSSDYGDGALDIRSFILQGRCTNGLVRDSIMRQIHLGSKLPDNLALSERTYRLDTETQVSAVKDLTKQILDQSYVQERAGEILTASGIEIDMARELKRLNGNELLKEEVTEVEKVLMNGNPDDGVNGKPTVWKLINGITAVSREKSETRKREMEEIAGNLMAKMIK